MDISNLTPADAWAKRHPRDVPTTWHPLLAHCIDVACVVEALLELPAWRARLSSLGVPCTTPEDRAALCLIAGLHDIGKLCEGFQKARGAGSRPQGHTAPALALLAPKSHDLSTMQATRTLVSVVGQSVAMSSLLQSAICHHGYLKDASNGTEGGLWSPGPHSRPPEDIGALASNLGQGFPGSRQALQSWEACSKTVPGTAVNAFAGLVMLADWIGSDTQFFPFQKSYDEDRWGVARAGAQEALNRIGIDTRTHRKTMQAAAFASLSPYPFPRGVQTVVDTLTLPDNASITVIEASTGSGKTEAALLWFARLFDAGKVDGLYFALPRRLAARELYERVLHAMRRLWGDHPPLPVVLAVPGYVQADGSEGQKLPDFKVQWDDPGLAAGRGWAAEGPKRFLAAPIAIGTIDQVLASTLKAKHGPMRGVSLLRHLLVVDEVHASDLYMTRLLREALRRQQQSGGHALLMSATLGSHARRALQTPAKRKVARQPLAHTCALPYPVVWTDADTPHTPTDAIERNKCVTIRVHRSQDLASDIAQQAVEAASQGARVLVIRNLVRDCIATLQAVEAHTSDTELLLTVDGVVAPHHARFAAQDRALLDAALIERLGRCPRDRKPVVVVATSTAEQSLDLDADVLLTDLCPMDVLLQRIGRVHRHETDEGARPERYRTARCEVFIPEEPLEELLAAGRSGVQGPYGYGTVYADSRILELTRRELEESGTLNLPADNRGLVERTTHPDRLDALKETHTIYDSVTDAVTVKGMSENSEAVFNLHRWDTYVETTASRLPTRLGLADADIEVAEGVPAPFGGGPHYRFTVPGYWCDADKVAKEKGPVKATFDGHAVRCEAFKGSAAESGLVYDQYGLRVPPTSFE